MTPVRLAVSNIAWSPNEEENARAVLCDLGVTAIEVAPTKFWPDLTKATGEESQRIREAYEKAGLRINGLQALLFGKPELVLFGKATARDACANYLKRAADLASQLGAKPMVFGSPNNRRVPENMSFDEADDIARKFFTQIGAYAAEREVFFTLEPNPSDYGCNYLTHTQDAASLVRAVGSPGLRLQIDAGEVAINDENVEAVISENCDIIGHVHISQPMLGGFDKPWPGHSRLARALTSAGYSATISIEMKRQPEGLDAVRKAVVFAQTVYLNR